MRYKVRVAYDGSCYHGWQTQRKGNSVEEAIQTALKKIHKYDVDIVGSGRTDSKVHALNQVFHFDSPLEMDGEHMKNALNRLLHHSIRIKQVVIVAETFHARFDAIGKRYEYYVSRDTTNPFIRNYMAIDYHILDVVKMREAAQCFLGTHDFTSFTSAKIDERKNRIRTLTMFTIDQREDVTHFIVEGSGFLRYMVRMMIETLIMVGKGRIEVKEVKEMLDAKDKHVCRYKAAPEGLYLTNVIYKE